MIGEFFAILSDGETRRLPVERRIQETLSEHYLSVARRFIAPGLRKIPLSRAAYSPDDGEAWEIRPFACPTEIAEAIDGTMTLAPLSRGEVLDGRVKGIGVRFRPRGMAPWAALQAIDRRKVLLPGGFTIALSGAVYRKLEEPALQLGGSVQAVVVDDSLVFESVDAVRRIVDIGPYYTEATEAELRQFAAHHGVHLEDEHAFFRHGDTWMRKRIALIADSGVLDRCSARSIKDVGTEFGVDVSIVRDGGREKVLFPAAKQDLKELVRLLGEDIFVGPLTSTQFESNSKRKRHRNGA